MRMKEQLHVAAGHRRWLRGASRGCCPTCCRCRWHTSQAGFLLLFQLRRPSAAAACCCCCPRIQQRRGHWQRELQVGRQWAEGGRVAACPSESATPEQRERQPLTECPRCFTAPAAHESNNNISSWLTCPAWQSHNSAHFTCLAQHMPHVCLHPLRLLAVCSSQRARHIPPRRQLPL